MMLGLQQYYYISSVILVVLLYSTQLYRHLEVFQNQYTNVAVQFRKNTHGQVEKTANSDFLSLELGRIFRV